MATTYQFIESKTLSSNSLLTFSSIPGTYKDLVLLCSIKTTHAAGGGSVSIVIGFNNDTTSSNYKWRYTQSYSASSIDNNSSTTGYSWGGVTGTRATGFATSSYTATSANIFGNSIIYISNYASSSQNKSISVEGCAEDNTSGGAATVNGLSLTSALWAGTAPITRIDIGLEVGNFVNPSTVYLYGISNS